MATYRAIRVMLLLFACYALLWVSRSQIAWDDLHRTVHSDVQGLKTVGIALNRAVRCVASEGEFRGECFDGIADVAKTVPDHMLRSVRSAVIAVCDSMMTVQ
jgi:hypothetical protein